MLTRPALLFVFPLTVPAEYNDVYCRRCGSSVLTADSLSGAAADAASAVNANDTTAPASSTAAPIFAVPAAVSTASSSTAPATAAPAFTVSPLPSQHWHELSELWFCHTVGNAHLDRLAAMQLQTQRRRVLVDALSISVHADDLLPQAREAWKQSADVKRLLAVAATASVDSASTRQQSQAQPHSHSNSVGGDHDHPQPHAAAPASPSKRSQDIFSPLPCHCCGDIIGSICLTVSADNSSNGVSDSSSDSASVYISRSNPEVRLLKHRLSNCVRKRPMIHMSIAALSAAVTVDVDASASCLCSSYASYSSPSSSDGLRLRCANMFSAYTFERYVTAELRAQWQRQPNVKFIIESADEGEEEEKDQENEMKDVDEQQQEKRKTKMLIRVSDSDRQWSRLCELRVLISRRSLAHC